VDADPQFNATQFLVDDDDYLDHLDDETKGTVREIFVPRRAGHLTTRDGKSKEHDRRRMSLSECTIQVFNGGPSRGKLDLLPSTLQLIDIELSQRGAERRLGKYLHERAKNYDFVIIDCPPTISIFTQAAIFASNKYLVPIRPDPLSVIGLPLLERWLEEFTDDNGLDIKPVGLVFTMVRGPAPARMKELMNEFRIERKKQVFNNVLSQSTYVSSSVEAHRPVYYYKPGCKAALQIIAITQEFLQRV
jgi:chromosome partitioning protein